MSYELKSDNKTQTHTHTHLQQRLTREQAAQQSQKVSYNGAYYKQQTLAIRIRLVNHNPTLLLNASRLE
jgi:hypothetical protein